ncbi:MAG: hypothetical protein RL431_266 [Actinomycetota bacterium]|jgi:hypothetical protein
MKTFFRFALVSLVLFSTGIPAAAAPTVSEHFHIADEEAASAADGALLSTYFDEMSKLPEFQNGGLTPDHKSLKFYLHGSLSPKGAEIIAAAERSGRNVELVFTRFTESEAWLAGNKLFGSLQAAGIAITGYGPSRDNATIEVLGPDLSPGNPALDIAEEISAKTLPYGMNMKASPSAEDPVTFESRHYDTGSPTPGGAILSGNRACTGGIGVRRPGIGDYILTAAHCFNYQNSQQAQIPGNPSIGISTFIPTLLGSPNTGSPADFQLDVSMVSYVSAGTYVDSSFFWGFNDTENKVSFDRTGNIPWDVNMCSSGAATGLRCNITRTSSQVLRCIDFPINSTQCLKWAHIVGVSSSANQIMFGSGDSGGPIYYVSPSTAERVAVGLVEGASGGTVSCGTANYYFNPVNPDAAQCSITNGRITALWSVWQQLSENGYEVISITN